MALQIDFFFDFMSPFAYLAHERLAVMADKYGYTLRYIPIDLPRAKLAAGNTGPANRDIPSKIRYLMQDLGRWADRYGLPLEFPASLDSDRVNRGMFVAIDRSVARQYANAAWYLGWGRGGDFGSDSLLRELAGRMDWDAEEFAITLASPETEARYENANREAHERGIFGVPMMAIGDDMWWGNDRLDFLEEDLCDRKDMRSAEH